MHTHRSREAHTNYTSSWIPFSNIHIFHDVHQYNKTLIDFYTTIILCTSIFHSTSPPPDLVWILIPKPGHEHNKSISK